MDEALPETVGAGAFTVADGIPRVSDPSNCTNGAHA
jgi:hypothetical protein